MRDLNTLSKQEFDVALMSETAAALEERSAEFALQAAGFDCNRCGRR